MFPFEQWVETVNGKMNVELFSKSLSHDQNISTPKKDWTKPNLTMTVGSGKRANQSSFYSGQIIGEGMIEMAATSLSPKKSTKHHQKTPHS